MATDADTDGGWAWVVLLLTSVCRVVEANVVISMGLFQVEFLKYFSSGISFTSLLSSVFMCLQPMIGPISGALCNVFSIRATMMSGGLVYSLGLISSCFATSMPVLFVTFSIIGGIGFGLAYTPLNVVIGHFFERRRSIANGISTSAAGLGFAIGPYATVWLLENCGWRYTMSVLACSTLQICVTAAACFPSKSEILCKQRNRRTLSDETLRTRNMSKLWFLGHPHWWFFCMNYAFQMIAWSIQVVHFPAFAETRNISLHDINSLFAAFGTTVTLSRMLCGFLCNDDSVDPLIVLVAIQGLQAVVTSMMPLYANSFMGFLVYEILVSLFFGAAFVPITPLAVRLFGVHRLATVFGCVMMCGGLGSLIGPILAGCLYDLTHSYAVGFHVAGLFVLAGSSILLLIPVVKVKDAAEVKDKSDILLHDDISVIVQNPSGS